MEQISMLTFRPIEIQDNPAIYEIVCGVLAEHGCTGPGWASGDPELRDMFDTYAGEGSRYLVVEDKTIGAIVGGGGYSRLKGTSEAEGICELQKFYFSASVRGKGLGRQLLEGLIKAARADGYGLMYLESVPQLERAVGLYEKLGFVMQDKHLGNTGHQENCSVYMTLLLK